MQLDPPLQHPHHALDKSRLTHLAQTLHGEVCGSHTLVIRLPARIAALLNPSITSRLVRSTYHSHPVPTEALIRPLLAFEHPILVAGHSRRFGCNFIVRGVHQAFHDFRKVRAGVLEEERLDVLERDAGAGLEEVDGVAGHRGEGVPGEAEVVYSF